MIDKPNYRWNVISGQVIVIRLMQGLDKTLSHAFSCRASNKYYKSRSDLHWLAASFRTYFREPERFYWSPSKLLLGLALSYTAEVLLPHEPEHSLQILRLGSAGWSQVWAQDLKGAGFSARPPPPSLRMCLNKLFAKKSTQFESKHVLSVL